VDHPGWRESVIEAAGGARGGSLASIRASRGWARARQACRRL